MRLCLLWLLLGVSCAGGPAQAERVWFPRVAVPPTAFRLQLAQRRGEAVHQFLPSDVSGELYRPSGDPPFPAVVLLHDCSGRLDSVSEQAIAARHVARGYAVLAVDSFYVPPDDPQCRSMAQSPDRMLDLLGALEFLARQDFIDAKRIVALGVGQGAELALTAVTPSSYVDGLTTHRFAAVIAYYPMCNPGHAAVRSPALVLIGDRDEVTPAWACRDMLRYRSAASTLEQLVVLPGAGHGFNLAGLSAHPTTFHGASLRYDAAADSVADLVVAAFLASAVAQ
jgi:dienelactone hydrolase